MPDDFTHQGRASRKQRVINIYTVHTVYTNSESGQVFYKIYTEKFPGK